MAVGCRSSAVGRVVAAVVLLLVAHGALVVSTADAQAGVPVAARDLPRGITLGERDVEYTDGTAGDAGASVPGPGWVTRRVISRGEPLREPAVGRPQLVRAGEEVDLVWRGGSIELRLRGTAMGAAAAGQRVVVRIGPRRRLEGVAVGPGLIQIIGETT